MRVRLGFVTNSSSTNHIICWSGAKEDLRKILEAHAAIFPTSYDNGYWEDSGGVPDEDYDSGYTTTPKEIIDAIVSKLDKAEPSGDFADHTEKQIESDLAWAEKAKGQRGYRWSLQYLEGDVERMRQQAEMARKRDWVLTVGFGDSHGDFHGCDMGYVMDYEGRHIRVDDETLGYTTEQNR